MNYLFLIIGLVILIKGADFLIDGSTSFAKKLKIPTLIIGLTIVSIGTSLPELLVNIFSALKGSTDVAFGNVIGSNLANILLILGITALIHPPKIAHSTVWKEVPFSLLGAAVLLVIANDQLIDKIQIPFLTRVDGFVLILFLAIFIFYLFEFAFKNKSHDEDAKMEIKIFSPIKSTVLIILGLIALYFGGNLTVNNAILIARQMGMSEFLISATIIAIGTSLPELVTSAKAALRKDSDLAVGNVVGSNIFNIFWILAVTAIIMPIKLPGNINFDILYLAGATLLLFFFMFIGRKHQLERWQGYLFIFGYILYLCIIIVRG